MRVFGVEVCTSGSTIAGSWTVGPGFHDGASAQSLTAEIVAGGANPHLMFDRFEDRDDSEQSRSTG